MHKRRTTQHAKEDTVLGLMRLRGRTSNGVVWQRGERPQLAMPGAAPVYKHSAQTKTLCHALQERGVTRYTRGGVLDGAHARGAHRYPFPSTGKDHGCNGCGRRHASAKRTNEMAA